MLSGTTEVITDQRAILEAIKQFQASTRKIWYACVEKSLPSFSVGTVKEGYVAAKRRGVKIRYITEITQDNFAYCRELMQVAELRHLERVKGNFALSETEYIAGTLKENAIVSLVRTDVKEIVGQQHLIFQTLWDNSQPADDRMAKMQ